MYSNSRNDVPRLAQRYGTIAAHTRRRASVLVVFVVFCVHMHSFAGLIRRTPPPTFSDTAITDRHSDTTIFQLRAHWVRISWSIGSEKSFGHVPPMGVEISTSCMQGDHLEDEQNAVDLYLYSRHTNYVRGYIVLVVPSFSSFMHLLVYLFVHSSTLRQSFAFNLYFKNAHISVTVYQIYFFSYLAHDSSFVLPLMSII